MEVYGGIWRYMAELYTDAELKYEGVEWNYTGVELNCKEE